MNLAQYILISAVRLYQWTLSPVLAFVFGPTAGCRFDPSCSQYALECIRTHGAFKGCWLAAKRLAHCHPWGGCGHDPVPPAKRRASRPDFQIPHSPIRTSR